MPWDMHSVMDLKLSFIAAWLRDEEPKVSLCARYGISRQTGYKLWRRYEAEGAAGLAEHSRAPLRHGRAMPAEIAVKIIEARRRKPYWGPKKLLKCLSEAEPDLPWPSCSSASALLKREGLSAPRRRRRRSLEAELPFAAVAEPNDAWCIDFKGWFRTADGQRCDPLTVTDAFSRMLLGLQIVSPTSEAVEAQMDRLFREHGLPKAIRSDNGSPFASIGAGGLTRLSARWVKMGIALERIQSGKPQQNGRHERMHGTLKPEACMPPSATPAAQQARFDAFRAEYNDERPHEGIGLRRPRQLYQPSPRAFPDGLEDPCYEADEQVRRVRTTGEIMWRGSMLFVSEALIGEPVGIRERDDGHWLVRFAQVPLLLIDRYSGKVARFGPQRPPRSPKPSPDLSAM